jgi:HNH endonuclease
MRPVRRGPVPEHGGVPKTYAAYGDARDDLIARLGDYCSYCELPCSQGPAVEHVQPKKGQHGHPELERVWDNFLLGCPSCNSVKGSQQVVVSDYYWPDQDNTFRAFKYDVDRAPQPADGLSTLERVQAERTLQLTGLDREPSHPGLTPKDRRWLKRREAWGKAIISFGNLQAAPSEEMRIQIVLDALGTGFWSVWMTVFSKDPDMLRRFVTSFVGTEPACFDAEMNPVPRPGGRI